jgi:hypothetical protein
MSRHLAALLLALSLATPSAVLAEDDVDETLPPDAYRSRSGAGLVLGQVAGGLAGGVIGYGSGLFGSFGLSTCDHLDNPWGCGEGFDDAVRGAVLLGPIAGGIGVLDGIIIARAAQRGADLPVIAGAVGATGLGSALIWLSIRDPDGGNPALVAGGFASSLVVAPAAAHLIANATEHPMVITAVGPRGTPGLGLAFAW